MKRKVYENIKIINFIEDDKFPKEEIKLKVFMIILIRVNDPNIAYYMLNSIINNEKGDINYYYNEMKKILDKINIPISFNKVENSIIINKSIVYCKEYHSFESILYYLKNQKKIKITDNECFYKYNYFLKNYFINEYFDKMKQLIKIIFKSLYFANLISDLFKKKKKN